MIYAKSLHVQEFRGIRDLKLEFNEKNFAICGPNGTGKSGIVDALEFVLTGNISRISGTGSGNLSLKEHGPHVDSRNNPQNAFVSLTVHIPSLKKDVVISRTIKDAKNPKLTPSDPDIQTVIAKVVLHPEFVLSRRELIRYILAEPGKRSKEVQALLHLNEIEKLRVCFQKIANASKREVALSKNIRDEASTALQKALNLSELSIEAMLDAINERRNQLSIPLLSVLEANTSIKDGVASSSITVQKSKFSKLHAKAEIEEFKKKLQEINSQKFTEVCNEVSEEIKTLLNDEQFLKNTSIEDLLASALNQFDDNVCPVCDTLWEPENFKFHVNQKLEYYSRVTEKRKDLEQKLAPVIVVVNSIKNLAISVAKYGLLLQPMINCTPINDYRIKLDNFIVAIENLLPLQMAINELSDIHVIPKEVNDVLIILKAAIDTLPEPNQQDAAIDFLIVGQEKLDAYRQASLRLKNNEQKANKTQFIFDTYAQTTTKSLEAIYKTVEEKFGALYRLVNYDDEEKFNAQLKPSIGKLGFDVDFYGRGFFPPGAYHSEGHQDGMGLCLYLALMDHLAGDSFTFAVLDDVLMSVDVGHRRQVSTLLREQFPNTQFLLTTHDEIWLRHMKTVGLIEPKNFVHFRTWNVDVGPTEWSNRDIWEEIDEELEKNDIPTAAVLLRRYLEYFSKETCQALRASVEFRADAQFVLSDLLPSASKKMKKLLRVAKVAAQSWGYKEELSIITEQERLFNEVVGASNIENWQVNTAVHYNEWANLHLNDFKPVVDVFKRLIDRFSCVECSSILYVIPNYGEAKELRCACNKYHYNLNKRKADN